MSVRPVLVAALLATLVVACGASGTPTAAPATAPASEPPSLTGSAPPQPVELQVFAAASLKKALAKVEAAYEAATPGVTLTVSTDSSAALETKIEQGAPADVFLSADTKNPEKLVDAGLAAGDVVPFAGNRLVVIVPTDNPAGITTPADLATPGVKVIAAADGVPIQQYTAQWLEKVAALPAYGAGFPDAYAANVVSREDNVGAVVTKVGLGEGDAGVVYVTDAKASGDVATIAIPDDENVPATYGGVVVKASANGDAAAAFLAWLAGPDGQAVLGGFGFLPPG